MPRGFDQMTGCRILLIQPVPIGFLDLIPEIPNVSESCGRAGLVGEFYANVVGVIFVLNTPSLKQCVFVLEFLVSECGDEFTREGLLFAERRVDYDEVDALVVERTEKRKIVADEDGAIELFRVTPLRCFAASLLRCFAASLLRCECNKTRSPKGCVRTTFCRLLQLRLAR